MNLLDRYVIRAVLGGVLVVLAVLVTLGAMFLFAGQQDDIGVGTYTRARRALVRAAQPAAADLRDHAHRGAASARCSAWARWRAAASSR